jgi:hypothetical protein
LIQRSITDSIALPVATGRRTEASGVGNVLNRRTFSGIIGLHAWSLSDSDFMRNHEGANLRLGDDAHPTPILDTAAFPVIYQKSH